MTTRRNVFAALVVAAALSWQHSLAADATARPNIVLIVADDLGYGDLGSYGAPDIRTPMLDRLAREGIRFTSFYSNGPECTPTRTALMTGRYQHRVGGMECAIGVHNVGRYDDAIRLAGQHELGLPVEEQTLPRLLNRAGYVCGMFGKWHLGYEPKFLPLQHGFAASFGILGGNADYFRHTEADGCNVLFENDRLIEREGYLTDLITDAALDWYRHNKDRPFFLYVPYTAPHSPLQRPDDDTGKPLPEESWNAGPRATFAAMVERMDAGIGRILQAIDDDGLRAKTLVIFMSDNGGDGNGRNSPYSGRKGTTYEGGIRVPCIARWPRQLPEGQVVPHVAITMDLTSSIVRIAGAEFPADRPADGIDILSQIALDRPLKSRQLFWRGRRGDVTWRAARDGDLKRIWKQDGNGRESWLFDLPNDPTEKTNLLADRADAAARLQKLMVEWEREVAPRR